MKEVKFSITMLIEDDLAEEAKTWEHHAERILDLDSYPEIHEVASCKVEIKEEEAEDEKVEE